MPENAFVEPNTIPQDEVEICVRHHNEGEELRIAQEAAQGDLFLKPPTQKEQVYAFIKSRGRVLTHELNAFGVEHCINSAQSRARELKAEGKIWRVREDLRVIILGKDCKEEAWSVYPADL
jgi:phosphopantetheinyl transferase